MTDVMKTGYISESGKIITPLARASFVYLFSPQKSMEVGKEATYGITLLFPADADLSILKTKAHEALVEKFGAAKVADPDFVAKLRTPFRDQGEFDYDGYVKGSKFIRASAKLEYKPAVVDAQNNDIIESRQLYSGCYVRAALVPFAYEAKGNKGVSFGLRFVQKIRDGEPLGGGGGDPSKDFQPVGDAGGAKSAGGIFA